jgi:subtilisin family serine protease
VILGFIDIGGFDFAHPDFLDRGHTRFCRIWDQGLPADPDSGAVPYGQVITASQIDQAVAGASKFGLPATELLRQSVQLPGSHATHVASIAGGNSGVCRTALLAGVSLAIPEGEGEGRHTFFDSTRLAHAVDYLFGLGPALADELGLAAPLPVAINISLGTNGHAHDGSSPISRWIDAALDEPGRCVVAAAGNAGQDRPRMDGDMGYLSGRIHTSGRVAASGLVADIEWEVLGNGTEDFSENEMEISFEAHDRFNVYVKPPSYKTWIGPIPPGGYVQNKLLRSNTVLSIYSERYLPANGANRISVFLSPRLREPVTGIEAGRWLVRLEGQDIHDGRFDAWIERDDIRPMRRVGDDSWGLPSLFSARSNVDQSSVSSLGCGGRVIAVANYDADTEATHVTSSQGPTRDGRPKPDISAPGVAIAAANGFGTPDRPWAAKTGTSMASPYVAGVAARMLARDPRLTAAQILGMARRTAQPLPGASYEWSDSAGFGRIRPAECLDEVAQVFDETELEDE